MALLLCRGCIRRYLQFFVGLLCGLTLSIYLSFNNVFGSASNYRTESSSTKPIASRSMNGPQSNVSQVRILCFILTHPANIERYSHVRSTWGRRCDKLLFMSNEVDGNEDTIRIVSPDEDDRIYLWSKTRKSFNYVYQHYYNSYEWFLKADDDTYVIVENLRYMLSAYPSSVPLYFGHQLQRYNVTYMSGGAAYVLSQEALRRLVVMALPNKAICPPASIVGPEDFFMGYCLGNVGVYFADSRLSLIGDNKAKFFPVDLMKYMAQKPMYSIPGWMWFMSHFKIDTGLDCCSNYSISFHYVNPAAMYVYEFLIYHVVIIGRQLVVHHSWSENGPPTMTLEQIDSLFRNHSKDHLDIDYNKLNLL